MRNVQNWFIEGSRLNYSGCRMVVADEDNFSNVRQEASRHFRNKKREFERQN
jgi:hypothetical protein